MRRIDSGRTLAAAVVAAAMAAAPALAEGWKEHYDAGLAAREAGDYDKAESLMKRALTAAEAAGGGGAHAVVESLVGLADVYVIQERNAEAGVVLDQALLILVRSPAPEPADVALVYGSLATLRTLQKNYPEAEGLLKRALAFREKMLGPNHPDVASTLNRLADVALMQKNHTEAETYARRALAIREARADADPLGLADTYHTLAGLKALQEAYGEADALFRRVVALKEKALGADHPDVAKALMEWAGVRLVKGLDGTKFSFLATVDPSLKAAADKDRAEAGFRETAALLARALAIRDKALGPDDPKTVEVVEALAIAETKQEDHARAEPYLRRLLAAREKAQDASAPGVLEVVELLADNALARQRYREAVPLLRRLIAARDAEAAKGRRTRVDVLEGPRLPTIGLDVAEADAPDDLDAKLRRAIRLAGQADDPAARPDEADLAFLKRAGAVPGDATLAALGDLRKVDLEGQPIDDAGMAHLRGLVNLKSLSVCSVGLNPVPANVTDAGLAHLRKLTDLRSLILVGTPVRGAGLDHLAGMTRLAHLELGHTLVDDAGLSHLPTLPGLQCLNLSGTGVTDASIPAIRRQTGLTYLGLIGTKISKAGVEELRRGRADLTIHEPDGSVTPQPAVR